MKGKLFSVSLLTAALLFTAAACTNGSDKEAGYSGGWHFDAEYHWRDPDENGDDWRGLHNFINDVCNLCGYSRKTGTIDPGATPPSGPEDPPAGGGDDIDDTKPSSPDEYGQGETEMDGLAFTMLYGEGTETGYSVSVGDRKNDADIEIPSTHNNLPVVAISDYGFSNATSLRSITIPDSVTAIGYEAFAHCTALKEVTVPDSVTFMDYRAFLDCTSLERVTLPKSLKTINAKTFYRCSSLKSFDFPEGLTDIQKEVFSHCTSLASVKFPKSLEKIESNVFYDCNNIRKVVGYDIESWMNIHFSGITSNPLNNGCELYLDDGHGEKLFTELNVPEGTDSLGGFLFVNCTSLKKVTIPDSVTKLGMSAFKGCPQLTQITADGIATVESGTFSEMPALTEISLKGAVTVEREAFFESSKLKTIRFGANLAYLGQRCCYGTSLDDLYLEGGTAEQWKNVRKYGSGASSTPAGDAWNYGVGDYTVHFSDGTSSEHGRV